MFNNTEIHKVNFEDIQEYVKHKVKYPHVILINTLPANEQECLIPHTIAAENEPTIINNNLHNSNVKIILYGKNTNDNKIKEQYLKLLEIGYKSKQIYVYLGGLFEWLLLQDIYGGDLFPTTKAELDLLKYKSKSAGLF